MGSCLSEKDFDFGTAICWIKKGYRVSRSGWNGKGMFIYYVPAGSYKPCTSVAEQLVNDDGLVPYREYVAMKTVDGSVVPWVASQTDVLAEDWFLIE